MQLRFVFEHEDVLALAARIAEGVDRGRAVLKQPFAVGRIAPGFRHHMGTVARPDLGLVGLDQKVESGRVHIAFLGQNGFERADAQLRLRQFRMVVVVMMMVVIVSGHGMILPDIVPPRP